MQKQQVVSVKKLAQFNGHKSAIFTLCGFDDRYLLSGSGNGLVVKWDLQEKDEPVALAKVPANVFSISYAADTNRLLVGQMNGGLHLLELDSSKELRNLGDGQSAVFDILYYSPTNYLGQRTHINEEASEGKANAGHGEKLYAATGDGRLLQWETKSWSLENQVQLTDESLRCLALNPTGKTLAVGASDNMIYLLDRESLELQMRLEGHENSVFSLVWSPDGNYLISGSRDAHLHIWDGLSGKLLERIAAHNFTINHIAWHPEGHCFATASRDKSIKIWDADDYSLLKVIDNANSGGHLNSVNKLVWSASGNSLISCSDDRSIMVWSIDCSTD